MKEYLRWRFCEHLPKKYRAYFDEWYNGITKSQMKYFEMEKERLNM